MDIEWENAVRSCFQSQLLQNALKDTLLHTSHGLHRSIQRSQISSGDP